VSLAWLLRRPGVTSAVVGATRAGHLEDAVAALELELAADDAAYLEELYRPRKVLLHL
jgi:aryl-alcohol dehydrogenase (NADP+)